MSVCYQEQDGTAVPSLWIKPTDALNSKFIGNTTLYASGRLSAHHQEFLAAHRHWYILCSFDNRLLPGAGWNCDSILVNKTNRRTEFQFYWYYDSTCFGQPFRPSSGVLSRTSALVRFMQFWWLFATRSRMEFQPTPGSKRLSKLHKTYQCRCMAKNSWWWAERLPETCRVVIPINLDLSATVGFIHKEYAK